jgi:hypothetical protein
MPSNNTTVGRRPLPRHLVRAGRDEALGAVVVVARAHVVVAGGDVAPFRGRGVGGGSDAVGHRRPFLPPDPIEVGFRGARLKPPADALDLVHGNGGIRNHALDDLHGVGPAQIAGKMHGPSVWLRRWALVLDHRVVSSVAKACDCRANSYWRHFGQTVRARICDRR